VKLLAVSVVTVDQVVDVVAYAPTFQAPNAGGVIRFFHSLRTKPAVDGLPYFVSFPYVEAVRAEIVTKDSTETSPSTGQNLTRSATRTPTSELSCAAT
jgi:hypothetical protein